MSAPMSKAEAIASRNVPALTAALRAELKANSANIPDELKAQKAWLCWRAPEIAANGKVKKVPLYPVSRGNRRGTQGGPEDLANLGTWREAGAAFKDDETIAGVGFATLPDFGVVAFDGDHCVKDNVIRDDAIKLTNEAYCEISPSDAGIRAFWLGESLTIKNHTTGFELFHSSGFVTVTGNQVQNGYYDDGAEDLPELTGDMRAKLEALCAPAGAAGQASERAPGPVDDLTRMVMLAEISADTIIELRSALAGMKAERADDRVKWIEVIHALASLKQTAFESDALDLAEVFSRRSTEKFDQDAFDQAWHSAVPTRITYKSIFTWAMADGWANPRTGVPAASQVATIESVAAAVATTTRRFPRLSMAAIISRKPPAWRVKGLLPNDGVALIYGASGSGKSFFCIDLAMTIAQGRDWRGQPVKQGAVVYVCAEGASDFTKRMAAYSKHRGDGPFDVIDAAPNLLIKADVEALIAELMLAPVAVVFLDTLACLSVGGDENSAKDINMLLEHCKLISRVAGVLVVLVHHTGKNGDDPRGSSALGGAVDTSIYISRADEARIATVRKQKGGPEGQEYGFKLITVVAGVDEDGEEVSSCVIEHTEAVPKAQRKQEVKGTNEKILMRTLQDAFDLTGEGLFASELIEMGAINLTRTGAKQDRRPFVCSRAIDSLKAAMQIKETDGRLVPV